MSKHTGHIELDRTVDSIIVGNRHRTDLGDLTALAESIERDGLLQSEKTALYLELKTLMAEDAAFRVTPVAWTRRALLSQSR